MSEENEFEWDPLRQGDISVTKELVSIHNRKFRNNEQYEPYKYQDYILKDVDFHEVDVSGLFFKDDYEACWPKKALITHSIELK